MPACRAVWSPLHARRKGHYHLPSEPSGTFKNTYIIKSGGRIGRGKTKGIGKNNFTCDFNKNLRTACLSVPREFWHTSVVRDDGTRPRDIETHRGMLCVSSYQAKWSWPQIRSAGILPFPADSEPPHTSTRRPRREISLADPPHKQWRSLKLCFRYTRLLKFNWKLRTIKTPHSKNRSHQPNWKRPAAARG